ncbi:MAG: ABC transporter ATP-binding protein [Christensenellaceae bacterium]
MKAKTPDSKSAMKVKSPVKTFKMIFSLLFKHKIKFIIAVICIGISSVASVYSASFIKELIILIEAQLKNVNMGLSVDFRPILQEIGVMIGIFAAGIVASLLYVVLMAVISQSLLKDVRNDMFRKMQSLPVKYFDTHSFGDTMSRFTNDTDALEQFVSQAIPNILSSLLTIIVSLVAMFRTSWQMTVIVLLTVFASFFAIKAIGSRSASYFVRQQRSVGKVNGYIEEMINGQKVVKVFCREKNCVDEFEAINDELCQNTTNANKYANIFMPVMGNLGYVQYALIAIIGGVMALNGGLIGVNTTTEAIAVIAAFLLLSRTFTRPINTVSQQFNSIVMALAGAERIFELIDEQPETDKAYVTLIKATYAGDELKEDANGKIFAWKHPHGDGSVTIKPVEGQVHLENVDFSYDGEKQVLSDINIDVAPGKKVAFVGATGAGKTTITNLINRFYDIDDGKIRFDGININKIKKSDLRRCLGIVLQDVHLFTGTIGDNIRYGKLSATDEEVEKAAHLAHADEFINLLPDGYDTFITGDGANLSQGQRQLLSIARVAIADPPVMILDEATSSIDTRTESIVQKGMDNLMKGRTVFVIAHRLSTIKNADNIMVMEKGRIIESGDHETLMGLKGEYYRMNS